MKCEAARAQLESYLDGELDRAALDEIEVHLAGCASCRAELGALEQLRTVLRTVPRYPAPIELRRRLARTDEVSPVELPGTRARAGGWWAIAASVLIGIGIGAGFIGWRSDTRVDAGRLLARDLLASHLRALAAASPVDVVSEDRHTVKPWFAGKIGESPPVIDPGSTDFPLLGGRIDYVGEQRTAVVVYGHRKHVIDMYVGPDLRDDDEVQLQGYRLTPCRLAGRSAVIVSDIDVESVRQFSSLIGCGR